LRTSAFNEFSDDEPSSQGKAENIMASLERSMHPELMKVHLCYYNLPSSETVLILHTRKEKPLPFIKHDDTFFYITAFSVMTKEVCPLLPNLSLNFKEGS